LHHGPKTDNLPVGVCVLMATLPSRPDQEQTPNAAAEIPAWPHGPEPIAAPEDAQDPSAKPTQRDALQVLLAFSSLHDQVRRRKILSAGHAGFDTSTAVAEFEPEEQFVLDEVLQLVAERGVAITGADGLAIALAENNEIVLRAAAGTVRPDIGARIDRNSAFSGASFRNAQIVICDDTETDPRVNLQACRRLGARSMVAVPLCGRRRVIGLLEAFSTWPFAFNDSDVRNLSLLAELIVGALKPEDEDRFADSARVAVTNLEVPAPAAPLSTAPAAPVVPSPAPPVAAAPVPAPAVQVSSTTVASPPRIVATEVPVSKLETKQLEPERAQTHPIAVPEPAPATSTISEVKPSALPELEPPTAFASPRDPAFVQPPTAKPTRGLGMLILLIGIVIVAAFAGGIWWKWKAAQTGRAMVATTSTTKANTAANPAPAPATNPNTTNATSDITSEAPAPVTPANPTDLAKFPRITGIRHWSTADSSTIVLDLEDQVQYEAHRLTEPDRIYFDLHDTQLAPELAGKIEIGDSLLNRIRVAQPVPGMTRVVLETKNNPNFSVSLEPNPYRLVVEVRKVGANPKGTVNLFPDSEAEKDRLAIIIPPPTKEDLQWRSRIPKMRVVVDAGHGGWDLGTVGRRGLLEKDLVLEIAERLGRLLESRLGFNVIYTRQDDNYISLDERADIANQAQADLFVSVHANYSDLPSARGVETYYTNTFSAPGSRDPANKEADSHFKNTSLTLSSSDLRERVEQSRKLAASVQRSLYGTLSAQSPGLRDRGIRQAGFVVLTESAMPGILAEVSFVSSPTDEQKLRSDGYREQIAEALYKGIARYAASAHTVKIAAK
jgi:N-acetylmuramoyl-L-alanine amidase/putative methionine-R-sulfoxide reductase with GAF domain